MREIAGGTGPIFNDNSLAELALQLLSNKPGDHIDEPTRRKADDNGYRLRGISVGMRSGHRRQTNGSSQCDGQTRAPQKGVLSGVR